LPDHTVYQKGPRQVKYKIALHKSDEGYSVSVPGLPGCWSQGSTEDEAIENIKSAIQEYLEAINSSLDGLDVREVQVAGNTMKFTLIYGIDDGWYVGRLQEIPGVISQGETLEELKENIADAYRLILEDAMGLPVPELHTEEIDLNFA